MFLKARGACGQQGSVFEARGDHKRIGWQYVIEKNSVLRKFLRFVTFTHGFLRVGVILYAFLHGQMMHNSVRGSCKGTEAVTQDRENPIS